MIEFRNVNKVYSTGTEAVHNANFTIEKVEFAFLVGSSGSRKIYINKFNTKILRCNRRRDFNRWSKRKRLYSRIFTQ